MQMYMIQRAGKSIPGAFLFLVLAVVCLEITGWAGTPIPSDLQVVSITSTFSDDAWIVELTVDVSHDAINEVSSLVVTAYDSATGSWHFYIDRVSINDPFRSFTGSTVNDYMVTLDIPKTDSGKITIEARAAHGDDRASTSWEGWIPQEASYVFSGGLTFTDGTAPRAVGIFESTQWILSIDACGIMAVTLGTLDCRFLCEDPAAEVPTWWRVWDSTSDNDEEPDCGEIIDSGWIQAADFVCQWNQHVIEIPPGWSGEIRFQVKMKRSGLADHAGTYSATLSVDVSDASEPY